MRHRPGRALAAATSVSIALGLGAPVAHAETNSVLYVNNNASDCTDTGGGAGSSATPFCTIQAAADAAGPGDTVDIAGGLYQGPVTITSSGTANDPIVFQAVGNYVVQMDDGPDHTGPVLTFDGASYVSFYGRETQDTNPPYAGAAVFLAGVVVNDSSDILLNGISPASTETPYSVQITGDSSGISLTDSVLDGPHGGVLVGAGGSGDLIGTNEISTEGSGVEVDGASDTAITSNTLWGQSADGDQIKVGAGATGTSIEDDIVAYPGTTAGSGAAISVDSSSAAATTEDYNVVWPDQQGTSTVLEPAYSWAGEPYASKSAFTAATEQGGHDLVADPQFNEYGPFADVATAPQINSADSAAPGWVSDDIYGTPCSADPDIATSGAGTNPDCERGAVQQEFTTAPTESFTPVDTLGVSLNSAMSTQYEAQGGSASMQQTPTPAVSYVVNWGDGTVSAPIPASATAVGTVITHTYATSGTYTISDTAELVGGGTAETEGTFTTASITSQQLAMTTPKVVHPGDTYTVSGELSLFQAAVPNTQVKVTRSINGGAAGTVGTFTTNASGAFSFTDGCSAASTVTYTGTNVAAPTVTDSVTFDCIPAVLPIAPPRGVVKPALAAGVAR